MTNVSNLHDGFHLYHESLDLTREEFNVKLEDAKFMKKDFFIALSIGFGVGLLIAISVIYAPQILSFRPSFSFLNRNDKNTTEKLDTTPTPPQTKELDIQSPKNEAIVSADSIEIKGTSDPKSTIIVSTELEDKIATPSSSGSFSFDIGLQEGVNIIYITSYLIGEQKESKELMLFKTNEDL